MPATRLKDPVSMLRATSPTIIADDPVVPAVLAQGGHVAGGERRRLGQDPQGEVDQRGLAGVGRGALPGERDVGLGEPRGPARLDVRGHAGSAADPLLEGQRDLLAQRAGDLDPLHGAGEVEVALQEGGRVGHGADHVPGRAVTGDDAGEELAGLGGRLVGGERRQVAHDRLHSWGRGPPERPPRFRSVSGPWPSRAAPRAPAPATGAASAGWRRPAQRRRARSGRHR